MRKFISMVMLYSFIIMVVSGILIFISPFGRLAMMIQWKVLFLDKMQWQALHIIFMVIFTLAGILHIFYNIKAIKNYLKNKSKNFIFFTRSNISAIGITLLLFFATVNNWEPLKSFVKLNKSFNAYWIDQFKQKQRLNQSK
jgi:formate hydrogenlyase subunit 3/multisubunit Na+/H+ antiporter MnhD subunit